MYGLGVAQAMGLLGHWHRSVSIFDDKESIAKQIAEMCPDVIWTHMVLWPPAGATAASDLATILATWRRRGSAVYLHDGDPRTKTLPEGVDVASSFSIALVNRAVGAESHWTIPALKWPYAAMIQKEIGPSRDEWACDLLFAGHLRDDGAGLYGDRTRLVLALSQQLGPRMRIVSPGGGDTNNRMLVADVAPSANAVLGFARPDVPGWIDTRVFQYPGSGGILIHDDAGDFLEPGVHYLKFDRSDPIDSILAEVERARSESGMRERAFRHIQQNHTWVQRVETALVAYYGR